MKKQWAGVLVMLVWGGVAKSQADTTMSSKMFMQKEPATILTSGTKQRKEMTMPFVGKQVIITRVDKGVEWTLNPKKKTYTEAPIALPYKPMPKSMDDSSPSSPSEGSTEDESEPTCTPEFKKVPTARTIAGLSASGYKMGCKENPEEGMTVWLAAHNATTKQADQDIKTFAKAHFKAQFANYPAKERAEMEKGLSQMASIFKDLPSMMGLEKLPEGLSLAMDMNSAEGKQVFYEMTALATSAIPGAQFEIPAGYTKAGANTGGLGDLGGMSLDDAMKEMQKLMPKQ